jgi:aspartyl-tRNA(Asn)/glutamyl-tRNA(Gln) amidotransferase subunit C
VEIDETLVRHVAKLARLELTDEEVAGIAPQLSRIFAHVDQVRELEVEGADPATQAPISMDDLRDDTAGAQLEPRAVLRNAPAHDGAFLVVPRFLGDDEGEA